MARTVALLLCVVVPLCGIGLALRSAPRDSTSSSSASSPNATERTPAPSDSHAAAQRGENVPSVLPDLPSLRIGTDETAPLRAKMRQRVSLRLTDVPLEAALAKLSEASGVPILLYRRALQEEGIAPTEAIVFDGAERELGDALRTALAPRNLTWIVKDDVVRVTTMVEAQDHLVAHVYDLRPLCRALGPDAHVPCGPRSGAAASPDGAASATPPLAPRIGDFLPGPDDTDYEFADVLIDMLHHATSGPWLEVDGTGGTTTVAGNLLVVRQTQQNHDEIDALLPIVRHALEGRLAHGALDVWTRGRHEYAVEAEIRRKLQQPLAVDFRQTPFRQAFAALGERLGVRVRIDEAAFAERGWDTERPVTLTVDDVSARTVLRLALDPRKMTALVRDGALVVTTDVVAGGFETTRVHDVREIVERFGMKALEDSLLTDTSGPWLEVDGTGGTVSEVTPGILVVRHSQRGHGEVDDLLADMRVAVRKRPRPAALEPTPESPNPDPGASDPPRASESRE